MRCILWSVVILGCSSPAGAPDAGPGTDGRPADDAGVDASAPVAPVATAGTLGVEVGSAASGQLAATDANGDPVTYRIETLPTKGTLTSFDPLTGAYTYTTSSLVRGTDSFTFQVSDGGLDAAAPATVDITIAPFNFAGRWSLTNLTRNGVACAPTTFAIEHHDDQLVIGSRSLVCGSSTTTFSFQPITILATGSLQSQGRTIGTVNDSTIAIAYTQSVSGCGTVSSTFNLAKTATGFTYAEAYVIPCAGNSTIAADVGYAPTAQLVFSGGDAYLPPIRAGGASTATLTVRNLGKLAATPVNPTITGGASFSGGAYPGTAGTCGAQIAGTSTCTLEVTNAGAPPGCAGSSLELTWDTNATTYGFIRGCVAPVVTSPTQIAMGGNFFCVLHAGGVGCWGDNGYGQTTVPALTNPRLLAAGPDYACAVHDGGVACWGNNQFNKATPLTGLGTITELSAGWNQACVLATAGLRCWGAVPTLPTLTSPSGLSLGGYHGCVLDQGAVRCWGSSTGGVSTPPPMTAPTQVSSGGQHSCALDGSTVVCWGVNTSGQTTVPALSGATAVSAGERTTCATDATGVHCWGDNTDRQTDVPALTAPVTRLDVNERTCALDAAGLLCW